MLLKVRGEHYEKFQYPQKGQIMHRTYRVTRHKNSGYKRLSRTLEAKLSNGQTILSLNSVYGGKRTTINRLLWGNTATNVFDMNNFVSLVAQKIPKNNSNTGRQTAGGFISKFAQQTLKIPSVVQISICESNNSPDVYVVFNSKDKETRFKIYSLAQEILLTDPDKPMDFHTINLSDFDQSNWQFIIPRDAIAVYKKVSK